MSGIRTRGTIPNVRYLGLDVGDRWIGLAVGDTDARIATPLHTMRRSARSAAADVAAIQRFCTTEGTANVVVGLPRNMDDSLGPQARRTLAFAERLRALGLTVTLCDERLSSAAAADHVAVARGRPPRQGERIDHVAAAIILQDYLDGVGHEDLTLGSVRTAGEGV